MALLDWLFGKGSGTKPRSKAQYKSFDLRSTKIESKVSTVLDHLGHLKTVPSGTFRFIALDVETACGDAGSICQIGLACVQINNEIQTFSMLIDPGTRFDPFNIKLHGIGPEHVVGALRFPEAIAAILPLLSAHHIVQHSSFDKRAIATACSTYEIATPDLRWSDSLTIARRAWPEFNGNGGHGLASLKKKLDLKFQHHDAGEDARAAAMVVLNAETQLKMTFEKLILPA